MIERVAIADIQIGERRRQDLGDITSLAKNIDAHGLIHPIVISTDNELIAGERRLRAHQQLGRDTIEVRRWAVLDPEEQREIELAENLDRKDLTPLERSRNVVALAEAAAEVLRHEPAFSSESEEKSRRGRPQKPDTTEKVAARIGIPETTLHEAKQHVATAEAYPALQKPDWKQYHVLEAKEKLNTLPEPERAEAVKLIDQPGIPPKDAIGIIGNLAAMEPERRGEVFRMAGSEDARERDLALTTAARLPPMPDPRSTMLNRVVLDLKKAARLFANDPLSPRIEALIPSVREVIAALDAAYQEMKDADGLSRKVS